MNKNTNSCHMTSKSAMDEDVQDVWPNPSFALGTTAGHRNASGSSLTTSTVAHGELVPLVKFSEFEHLVTEPSTPPKHLKLKDKLNFIK